MWLAYYASTQLCHSVRQDGPSPGAGLGTVFNGAFPWRSVIPCVLPIRDPARFSTLTLTPYHAHLQIQYGDRTLYDCGTNNYPADYLTDPACTALPPATLRDQLKLQRSVTEWPWEAVALVSTVLTLNLKS